MELLRFFGGLNLISRFVYSLSGQFQQVWRAQEEVGWWDYGFQILSQDKG